jgi:type II secretory pathway pseudopilin PulG
MNINKSCQSVLKGQSLFEVIFALGIAAIILLAMATLSASTLRNSTFSTDNAAATQLATQATEWLRSERDKDWTTFAGRANALGKIWCLPSLTWPGAPGSCSTPVDGTIYIRTVTLKSVDAFPSPGDGVIDTINAEVSISWNNAQGTHDVKNNASFTDWRR